MTGLSETFPYTWEDSDSPCDKEPFRDEERILLNILHSLSQQYTPPTPPPLWDHEEFTYDHKTPQENASFHYCLVNKNQFLFCANNSDCKCDQSNLYYNLMTSLSGLKRVKSDKGKMGLSKEIKLQRRAVSNLAKQLRNNCDRIFDRSLPFIVDSGVLKKLCDAINSVFTNRENLDGENKEDLAYQDLVMFLSDFCQQTPSLCIALSNADQQRSLSDGDNISIGPSTSSGSSSRPKKLAGTSTALKDSEKVDISLFKSLQFLELRNTPPNKLTGMNAIRMKLQKLKCSRCLLSIGQVLKSTGNLNLGVAQIWPELREVDLSYNRVGGIMEEEIEVLELCPSLEVLNLSRNRIVQVDDKFSRILNSLSVLNLSYNQLSCIPPIPPNVKVLLLSHNLITALTPQNLRVNSFITSCPLKNIEVLDLSTNLISKESDLLPLKEMCRLKKLNMTGNPLSFIQDYRQTIGGYLSRYVISRKFELDKKSLSSSEVRMAIEDCKQGKFIPYIPANSLLISQASSAMSASLSSSGSMMSTSTSMHRSSSSVSQLKSMTQSYDSSSSSMRSLKRKKPKIREIITFPEDRENSYGELDPSLISGSSSSPDSSSNSRKDEVQLQTDSTRQALQTLRDKYGPEHWLLRQAGTEVEKLLNIPNRPINYDLLSRSLPQNARELNHSYSQSPPSSIFYDYPSNENRSERFTNEELILITNRRKNSNLKSNSEERTPGSTPSTPSTKTNTPKPQEGPDFFSCFSGDSEAVHGDVSIFDLTKNEPIDEIFVEEEGKKFESFKIFQHGEVSKLIVYDGYLMEVNPSDGVVQNKWDLNCLFALEEERHDTETESVEFRLKFDTMRKLMRERSFIMGSKEFGVFDKLVSPYIEERTLQEFTEALQCTKCHAQFSRAMAGRTVKHEKGQQPVEVSICPNPQCGNDILVTLDEIPLPNNECLDLELELARGSMKCSTPVSAHLIRNSSLSQSIPKGRSPRVFDIFRLLPSSLTSSRSVTDESITNPEKRNDSSFDNNSCDVPTVRGANSVTPTSSDGGSGTATNAKSESDIEVLSTDSSSIEVLGRHCPDSGSEIDAEEAIEIPVIEPSTSSKLVGKAVVMSESTSSSSCADSIVTTYERNLLPISQPLSSPSRLPSAGSSLCTNASFASTSTLTTNSFNSPVHTSIPVRYDYVNFARTDHRLHVWSEISVFKSDERLLALTKCMIISDSMTTGNFLGIVIFSSKKVYLYRIIGSEGDKPQDWLQRVNSFDLSKFTKLDVLIGRHGVGVDFSGKYFAFVFRDSERTSGFLEFFMSDICGELTTPPMVRDFSQTQKLMLSPTDPISYFGIMRFAVCDSADKSYAVSAILLTNKELLLITDLSWMAGRCDTVTTTHGRELSTLCQVESMESDGTFLRLVFELEKDKVVHWELVFETESERLRFEECLKADMSRTDVPFICLSQPLEY